MKKKIIILIIIMFMMGIFLTSDLLSKSYLMRCQGGDILILEYYFVIKATGSSQFTWLDRHLNSKEKELINTRGMEGAFSTFPNMNSKYTYIHIRNNGTNTKIKWKNQRFQNFVNKVLSGKPYFLHVEMYQSRSLEIKKIGI